MPILALYPRYNLCKLMLQVAACQRDQVLLAHFRLQRAKGTRYFWHTFGTSCPNYYSTVLTEVRNNEKRSKFEEAFKEGGEG